MALGLGPGGEVIVTALTWVTSTNCAEYVGALPVLADIELTTNCELSQAQPQPQLKEGRPCGEFSDAPSVR